MTSKKKTSSKKKATRSKKPKETTSTIPPKKRINKKADTKTKLSPNDGRKTNNLSRINRIKQANKEEIRKKFKAKEYIKQLEQSMQRLEAIIDNLNIANTLKAKLSRKEKDKIAIIRQQIDVLIVQRDTIRVQIDLNLRRLKYCIPELKAMELTDNDGNNPLAALASAITEAAKS